MQALRNVRVTAGNIGEEIVLDLFSDAVRTDDWFDDKKDGVIGELTYEVKTIRLNHFSRSFWIDEKQWKKCDEVDLLFFVQMPESEESDVPVYLAIDHRKKKDTTYASDGRRCRMYPLTSCLLLGKIKDERAKLLFDTSRNLSQYPRFE